MAEGSGLWLEGHTPHWTPLWIDEDFRAIGDAAIIVPIKNSRPNLLVPAGFSAFGTTQRAVPGEVFSASMQDGAHKVAPLFDVTRKTRIAGGPVFVKESFKSCANRGGVKLPRRGCETLDDIGSFDANWSLAVLVASPHDPRGACAEDTES